MSPEASLPSSPNVSSSSRSRAPGPLPKSDSVQSLVSLMNPCSSSISSTISSHSTIRAFDTDSKPHDVPFDPQNDYISLSGLGLHSVSLQILSTFNKVALRELSLAANVLDCIDLSALSACPNLAVLTLNSNRLSHLDLTPLSHCPNLERLWLHDNCLTSLDISALSTCKALRSLYLEDNSLHDVSLDLSPLEHTQNLRSLRLGGNHLNGSLDLTPLLQCPALSVFNVDTSVQLIANADSTQARVSPALRRIVLDIKFLATTSASPRPAKGRTTPPVSPRSYNAPSSPRRRTCPPPPPPPQQHHQQHQPIKSSTSSSVVSTSTPILKVLLIAFRRLARYATEDCLSKCGKVMIRAADQGAVSRNVPLLKDSHLIVLHSPSSKSLRQICDVVGQIPTVVLGTERYRSTVDNEMLALLDRFNFYLDPLSEADAKMIYGVGLGFLTGVTNNPSSEVTNVDKMSSVSTRASSPLSEEDEEALCPSPHQMLHKSYSESALQSRDVGIELEDIEDEEEGTTSSEFSYDDCSFNPKQKKTTWADVSRLLSDRKSRRSGSGWGNYVGYELSLHGRNKLRAERVSVEAAFHDLGGYATMDSCLSIARSCGLPKCAGPLLFRAAFGSSFEIEATTPEAGVPNPPMERKKRISRDSFLIYWDSRLKAYDGEERLSNVLEDSHFTRVQTTGESSGHSAYGTPLVSRMKTIDRGDASRSCDAAGFNWQASVRRSRVNGRTLHGGAKWTMPTDMWCPCDTGIEDLIRAFMEGRSSRFGPYALVKMSEAIAIGSSLVMSAIHGVCGNRLGGRARPVCPKEVRDSKLNAAMIAAEVGIFEGVASGLSMNEIRSVKGCFATEVSPGAIPRSGGCALNCSLSLEEVQRFCLTRKTLLPGAVELVMRVHCRNERWMNLSEFSVLLSAVNDVASDGAVDYFFSVADVDQNDRWTLADVREFHMEKERMWREDGMAVSELRDFWVNMLDMIGSRGDERGLSRRDLLNLGGKERKVVIQSLLFVDDDYSLLNIRKTMEMNKECASAVGML